MVTEPLVSARASGVRKECQRSRRLAPTPTLDILLAKLLANPFQLRQRGRS